ncbi:SufD family Fe-S cluster assembly protein [Candidatus Gracilibacteria bacterium]|nr:SufD family Fe-S cluster assembly protein [Candidatus Gracilibacteria bacterium]
MKTLTESRLYLSNELEINIHLADGVEVLIFDEKNILEKVTFGVGAKLTYCGYFSEEDILKKHFLINGGENSCEIYAILSSRGEKIKAQIYGELASSYSYLDMHIVSFVSDLGDIDLDGAVEITSGVEKVEGYLSEENIFLGSTGKVRGIPTLKVHSNDVKAAHACNMQRIPDETLYYLRSRGLPKEDATVLLLQSYIAKIFGKIRENNEDMYNELEEKILAKLR